MIIMRILVRKMRISYYFDGRRAALSLEDTIQKEKKAKVLLDNQETSHRLRLREAEEHLQSWTANATQPPSDAMYQELRTYNDSLNKIFSELQTTGRLIATGQARVSKAEQELRGVEQEITRAEISKYRSAANNARAFRKRERDPARWERHQTKLQAPEDVYRVCITVELGPLLEGATPAAPVPLTDRLEHGGDEEIPAGNGDRPSLRVSYVVRGASWTPRYDVQLDTLAKTGILTYRAHICNHTGEDWKDARVAISTGQASFGGLDDKAPRLDSWHVSYRSSIANNSNGDLYSKKEKELRSVQKRERLIGRRGQKRAYQEYDDPSGLDIKKGSAATALTAPPKFLGVAAATTESHGPARTYELPGAYTVASSARLSQCIITECKLTDTTFSHISVPKLRPSAFLKARARNPLSIPLFKGPVGLSLDGGFLGAATIPHCAPGGHFELNLGVDESVLVEYREPTRTVTPYPWAGRQATYKRCISIHNMRKNRISLAVFDQVPVSDDQNLEVCMKKPLTLRGGGSEKRSAKGAGAGVEVVSADGGVAGGLSDAMVEMGDNGEVKWEVMVEGGSGIRIRLEYEAD